MAADDATVVAMAEEMIAELDASNTRNGHHGLISRYFHGDHDLPYMPVGATEEYMAHGRKAITNWLPLVLSTFVKALWVDGYRPGDALENSAAWKYWQRNKLDAWQSVAHEGALLYGVSYVRVLPGTKGPQIKPLRADRTMAFYEDDDAEFPVRAIERAGTTLDDEPIYRVYDEEAVYTIVDAKQGKGKRRRKSALDVTTVEEHNLGVCPLVRFRPRLAGESLGVIKPLINVQDRINEAVFMLLIALQYASFRQRWATGLAIPTDQRAEIEVPNPDFDETQPIDEVNNPATVIIPNPDLGKPIETFEAAIERLWTSESSETQFGEFSQTDTGKHIAAYDSAVRTLLALAEVPPTVLTGDIQNVSADALASLYDATIKLVHMWQTIFGESWELVLQLADRAGGGKGDDESAEVRWRDTSTQALAGLVDALTKMVQMANFPEEAAWEKFPGITEQDIKRLRLMRKAQQAEQDRRDAAKAEQAAKLAAASKPDPAPVATPKTPAPAKAGPPAPRRSS